MFDAAAMFAASINFTEPHWLTLLSQSGTGKTTLAKSVWTQFMEQNRFVLKLDVPQQRIFGNTAHFCNWRNYCSGVRQGSFGVIDDLCSEWFVILDDVGSEHDPNGFIASTLDRILNSRQNKWTMITSNLSLEHFSQIDPRVASRMIRNGSVVIECGAIDYNLREK